MENHPWRYDFKPTNYTLTNFHVLINIIWQRTEKLNVQWGGADLARMDSNATDLDVRHVNVVGAYNEFRFSCLFLHAGCEQAKIRTRGSICHILLFSQNVEAWQIENIVSFWIVSPQRVWALWLWRAEKISRAIPTVSSMQNGCSGVWQDWKSAQHHRWSTNYHYTCGW